MLIYWTLNVPGRGFWTPFCALLPWGRMAPMSQHSRMSRERMNKVLIGIALLVIFCASFLWVMHSLNDYHPVPIGPTKSK